MVANKILKNLTPKNREEDFIWSAVSQIEKDKMSLNYNNLKNALIDSFKNLPSKI